MCEVLWNKIIHFVMGISLWIVGKIAFFQKDTWSLVLAAFLLSIFLVECFLFLFVCFFVPFFFNTISPFQNKGGRKTSKRIERSPIWVNFLCPHFSSCSVDKTAQ